MEEVISNTVESIIVLECVREFCQVMEKQCLYPSLLKNEDVNN